MKNLKSDVLAKAQYIKVLNKKGFTDARVTSSPSDIQAEKNGVTHYFEIKYTTKSKKYFGAATLTEWQHALENPDTYFFVIALLEDGQWFFTEYSVEEFMAFSNIPPFKIFFNIPDTKTKVVYQKKLTKSVKLNRQRIQQMIDLFKLFKQK